MLPSAERVIMNPQEVPRRQVQDPPSDISRNLPSTKMPPLGLSDSINHRFTTCRLSSAAKVSLVTLRPSLLALSMGELLLPTRPSLPQAPSQQLRPSSGTYTCPRYTVLELSVHGLCHCVSWHENSPRLNHDAKSMISASSARIEKDLLDPDYVHEIIMLYNIYMVKSI